MANTGWIKAPIWDDWLALTRLQWSGRIAFDAERKLRGSQLDSATPNLKLVKILDCGAKYETSVENHVSTISDYTLFCSLILLRSYSLVESHCKLINFIVSEKRWDILEIGIEDSEREQIESSELRGGVEAWSGSLMSSAGQSWADVYGGKVGLIEVSILRNILAHGRSRFTSDILNNAENRGCRLPFKAGSKIEITFCQLHEYRGRMKSLCRILGDGVIHLHRGTHRSLPSDG